MYSIKKYFFAFLLIVNFGVAMDLDSDAKKIIVLYKFDDDQVLSIPESLAVEVPGAKFRLKMVTFNAYTTYAYVFSDEELYSIVATLKEKLKDVNYTKILSIKVPTGSYGGRDIYSSEGKALIDMIE